MSQNTSTCPQRFRRVVRVDCLASVSRNETPGGRAACDPKQTRVGIILIVVQDQWLAPAYNRSLNCFGARSIPQRSSPTEAHDGHDRKCDPDPAGRKPRNEPTLLHPDPWFFSGLGYRRDDLRATRSHVAHVV